MRDDDASSRTPDERHMTIDRRTFLATAAVSVAVTLRGTPHALGLAPDPDAFANLELLGALGPDEVREIGRAYRALVPAEDGRGALERALRPERRATWLTSEDAVHADFAAGRVIAVRGWLLSRTEARRCALFSLRSA
jgi:hypothetical protein